MDAVKNFDEFYNTSIQPWLHRLQKQQRLSDYWMFLIILLALAFFPMLAFFLVEDAGYVIKTAFTLSVILLPVSIWQYIEHHDAFEEGFKTKIIGQIVHFLHPGLEYKSGTCVSETDYRNSSLFRNNIYDYSGDDLIKGSYKNIYFRCSELRVVGPTLNDSDGPVFRGLFFAGSLNTAFSGGTYIWRNNNIQLPKSIADEHYRMMPMPEIRRVHCSNGSFENYYSVFATDLQEASSIVTERMMESIIHFRNQINRDISLSFVAGICYVAIPFDKPLFEATGDEAGSKEEVKEYFFTVLLILSIINQLQLHKI